MITRADLPWVRERIEEADRRAYLDTLPLPALLHLLDLLRKEFPHVPPSPPV